MCRFVASAPLTYSWLAVLLVTTLVQRLLPDQVLDQVLEARSTNALNLADRPVTVLVASLFWIDGVRWAPYLVTFSLFVAPVERWLGWRRWLFVGLSGHVLATVASQGLLVMAVRRGMLDAAALAVQDVGVSIFQAAMIGVLSYRFRGRWRWIFAGGAVVVHLVVLVLETGLANLGHLLALFVGLCMFSLARSRPGDPWDPSVVWRRRFSDRRGRRAVP